ncbi:MAG: nitroreductase [Pseudomonadales bacterium]|nr:nitroreductase [Pseudomonadales bacterium]
MTNNPVLSFLQQRNSSAKLTAPAPSAAQLNEIFKAALRAPDHGGLKPWSFITIEGDARVRLGELFVKAELSHGVQLDEDKIRKICSKPLRAPLIIAVAASVTESAKVPDIEQIISAGCAAQNILLAVEALGYAAIWRTGDVAYDDFVQDGLGLEQHQMLLGFLYIGTRDMPEKPLPERDVNTFVRSW